ncbi:hypothetical protein DCAR_0414917 [Daucus carota subsp. sativus]|uniref:MULE transposase domain-containing protein n=1 Tax=Daucus carota subsp. sativus TaxID=79200 RepID=A0AAF0WTM9_DAUCS|nr:hypothetical protein DCAR_0414917 [Daucus carota subsp. sativus]
MDIQVDFNPNVLRRARRKCMKNIKGIDADQYAKLWDYRMDLLQRNPNSTIELQFESGKPQYLTDSCKCLGLPGVFKRMYKCFGRLKHAFKLACRKVIGLDGTHIKNHYKGQILTTVGVDPNNCMYPLAYAVVETEKKDC